MQRIVVSGASIRRPAPDELKQMSHHITARQLGVVPLTPSLPLHDFPLLPLRLVPGSSPGRGAKTFKELRREA